MLDMLLSITHCVLFLQVIFYFPFLFSLCGQSYKKSSVHASVRTCVSLRVGVRADVSAPGQILVVVGLKPVSSSRLDVLYVFVCMWKCLRVPWQTNHPDEWCASWMLVVWQQHIIISLEARTEWSLQPPPLPVAVCSALIYTLKSSVVWSVCVRVCVWRRQKRDKHHVSRGWSCFLCDIPRSCQWMNMMWWIWSTRHWC